MKKFLAILLMFSFIYTFVLQNFNLNSATAQNSIPQSLCVNLSYNMTIGSRDYNTEGEVSKLQIFLINSGFLNHSPTGYFGVLTKSAIANYQTANNIYPNAGYLGPITRASINKDTCSDYVPSNPSSNPTFYCDVNGIKYTSEVEYKQNCTKTIYTYTCTNTGQVFNSLNDYNSNCLNNNNGNNNNPSNTAYFQCTINGQVYYNAMDYQNYCKITNNNNLPVCNLGNIYNNTNSCVCPSGYTFMNTSNGYKCDNGNYACTLIYIDPSATSPSYDRCHYKYYCSYDNLYHNDASYCKSTTQKYTCALNYEYQGGGFVATNDCTCPSGSNKISLGNFGEIYKWKCVANY